MNNYRYKDSAIAWLGDVPEHWELKRLKDVSKIIDCKNRTPEYFDDAEYLVIRTSNVRDGRINLDNPSFTDESNFIEWTKRGIPPVGSILFTREAPAGEVCLVPEGYKSCLGQRMMNFIPKNSNYSIYLLYYFLSQKMRSYLETITSGSTVHHLRIPQVFDISVIVPPLSEQKSIAAYLDTKTAQCDRKIDLLTQKATQYGKLKQSLINETVTRGLDKSVPMKDSGVEWIGEVPEHWEIIRIKDYTYVKGRIGWQGLRSSDFLDEGDSYCVTGTDLVNGSINWSNCYFVSEDRYEQDKYIQLRNQDLLITKDGTIGKIALINYLPLKTTLNSGLFVTRPKTKKYTNEFMYWVLNSSSFRNYIDLTKGGSTIQHLYQNVFDRFLYACPPLSEQKAIADYLDTKTAQIDQIIQTINTQIEKLKELRKTLINDVVTGKMKVTGN
jgi:type I restriction enzyme S subunit